MLLIYMYFSYVFNHALIVALLVPLVYANRGGCCSNFIWYLEVCKSNMGM